MSDEPIEETPFETYECSLGTVIGHTKDEHGQGYLIQQTDGQTVGVLANGEPSVDAVEGDIANPRALPAPVPTEITRPRFIIGLRKVLGLTEGHVFALISSIADPEEQEDARDWWEHGVFFRRDDHWLLLMAERQGVTPEQLDNVFRNGANA
jgi:hypothetical protein